MAQKKYSEFVKNAGGDKEAKSPLKDAVASTILGGVDFVREIKGKYLRGKKVDRNLPALRNLKKGSIHEITEAAKKAIGGNATLSRKAAIYLCHRYSGRKLREIGDFFNTGESSVSQTSRRFSVTLDKDKKLSKKVKSICQRLRLCNV